MPLVQAHVELREIMSELATSLPSSDVADDERIELQKKWLNDLIEPFNREELTILMGLIQDKLEKDNGQE